MSTPRDFAIGRGACAWCLRAALVVAMVFSFSLTTSGSAHAAECADMEACFNSATWQKAISDDYYKKAFFSGVAAQNNFKAAADWHNKSVGAFLSGDGNAAQWYQALAESYARNAAASAKAANDFSAQGKFWAAAADHNFRRYIFISNAPEPEDGATAASIKNIGVKSLKKAKLICNRTWQAKLACIAVSSVSPGGVKRFVWDLTNDRTCLRQEARPGYINPSTGYVERIVHVCLKYKPI